MAIRYSEKVVALHNGKQHAFGAPRTIITADLIWQVFDSDSDVVEVNNNPIVITKVSKEMALG